MPKIIEKITFHAAYGSQVRLHNGFYDEEENRTRMSGYMPIRSHRQAFLTLAASQQPDLNRDRADNGKVFMLTGSFGTGKSHLCLMLANYFSSKITSPDLASFLENWKRRDPDGANRVRDMRGEGRYLVAICEFGTGKPFEDMILSAIEETLEKEGAEEISLNSLFKAASHWIEERERQRQVNEPAGMVLDVFKSLLGGEDPEAELAALKRELAANSTHAMDRFQEIYEKTTGQRLTIRTDSLEGVIKDLMGSPQFKQRYRGLVILADEFGYALDYNKVPISVFQAFAEMSKDGVNGLPIIFIGVGHRRFEAYGAGTPQQADFRVVKDRVTEVSLQSEELEQIIAALISPDEEWKQFIQPNWLFTRMSNEAQKNKLFEYLSEPELLDQIVCSIYPMHPMAVYCLTKLSQELGSAARSVFSFFRRSTGGQTQAPGSYPWFVEETDINKPNGDFNIYTPELLVTYFDPEIVTTNQNVRPEVHDQIRNYRAALEETQKFANADFTGQIDPFTQQVLDLMFVYRVSGIPVTGPNLRVGLNLFKPEEQRKLEGELNSLKEKKIIFLGNGNEFEFRRSNMADLDTLIAGTRADIAGTPFNPAEKITTVAANMFDLYTVGQEHNAAYHGDKRLRRVFAAPQDLLAKYRQPDGSEITYWQKLDQDRVNIKNWPDWYEGVMVYVLCENENDILTAQQAVRSNNFPSIIVGIPHSAVPLREKLLDWMAVQTFMETLDYNKLGDQEKSLVADQLGKETAKSGRVGEVIKLREKYLNAVDLVWYQKDGRVLLNNPRTGYEPADMLLNQLYNKRNNAEHTILNLAHPKFSGSKENALRDAVKHLIAFDKPIPIDSGDKESQGEIRYLKNVLVHNGVLYPTDDYSGTSANYQLVTNLERFREKFPALVELVEKLRRINRGEKFPLWPYLSSLTEAPYGLGPFGLSLFLAVAVRYLGDEMRIKLNPTGFGYADTHNPDTIIDLATGKSPTATVERIERTGAVIEMVDGIYKAFSETPPAAGMHYVQSDAWRALTAWWQKRTRLERTSGIYRTASTAKSLAEFLTENEDIASASQTFLEKIKVVYGYSEDTDLDGPQAADILGNLVEDKATIETYTGIIKDQLIKTIGRLFAPDGGTYMDYTDAIRNWVNSLHPDQKDKLAAWQSPTSRTLIEALPMLTDIKKMLLEDIPATPSFNFGKVNDWRSDHSQEYINKFKDAFLRIENGMPKVDPPTFSVPVSAEVNKAGDFVYQFHGTINVQVGAPAGVTVRVALNEDPKLATQFQPVIGGTTWAETVTESCTWQLVSQNPQGEFSKRIRLIFRNLDDDYKLIPESQARLDRRERFYTFRNPGNAPGLAALLRDLVEHLNSDGLMTKEEIRQVLVEILKTNLDEHAED